MPLRCGPHTATSLCSSAHKDSRAPESKLPGSLSAGIPFFRAGLCWQRKQRTADSWLKDPWAGVLWGESSLRPLPSSLPPLPNLGTGQKIQGGDAALGGRGAPRCGTVGCSAANRSTEDSSCSFHISKPEPLASG